MPKIVISANTSFNLYNFRLPLIKELQKEGFEVIALAPVDEYTEDLKREVEFTPLRFLDRRSLNPFKDFFFFKELLEYYKKLSPNLVINFTIKNNLYGTLAASLLGIKRISVVTGLGYLFLGKNPLKVGIRFVYKNLLRLNQKVIFQNREDLLEFPCLGNKAILIPGSGVDTDKFSPHFCQKLGLKPKYDFLFIGRLLKDKGIYELVEAVRILKSRGLKPKVAILGKLDQGNPAVIKKQELDKWIKENLVEYLGFTKDVRKLLCQSKAVVLPSYREGLPRALLEAMAMEKPIIATDIPGCREICFDNINCLKVEKKNPISLAQAMEKFLNFPPNKVEAMGKYGRKLVEEKYSTKVVNELYLKTIEEVLNGA